MAGLIEQLFRNCPELPQGLPSYTVETHIPLIQDAYNRLYPDKYRIVVFDQFGRYKPQYKGPDAEFDVCIVHNGNAGDGTAHFDGVRCLNTLFGKSYYCVECEKAFGKRVEHTSRCVQRCRGCGGFGPEYPCKGGLRIECVDCNGSFVSRECYDRHFASMCARFHKCKDCGVSYDVGSVERRSANKRHECGQKFCTFCCTYHRTEQPCFIQKIEPKEDDYPCRFVAYDFECSQNTKSDPHKESYLHEVNFACAQVTCTECIAADRWKDLTRTDCKVCGPVKNISWSAADGQNPLKDFVDWILHSFDKAYSTYALRAGGIYPEVVRTGHKMFELRVEKKGVVVPTMFRDSYCLMSQPLSDLVDAYKLGIEEKQFFPHLFNKPQNYTRHSRRLPKRKYYAPESMKPEKRKEFKNWYRENREYCTNDVQILLHALVAFRREWLDVCQDDVLRHSMTIASACMRFFRTQHLQPDTLVLSPEYGFERRERQSVVALKYLK
ncbi:hypothetical protein AAVH_26191, partial [Aphelenchoides avenae]